MKNIKENSRSQKQYQRMEKAEKLNICPFCKEGLKKIHGMPIEKEVGDFFVTKNAFPYKGTKYHYLIIPKEHISSVMEFTSENWAQVGALFQWVSKQTQIDSGGFFLRFGDMHKNGSSIEHIHFQIISGTKGDYDDDKEPLKVKLGYK